MAKFIPDIGNLGEMTSLSSSPFAPGKVIIKKASFRKGQVPAHLTGYTIKDNPCKGVKGTVTYKGKLVPAAAKCLAEKRGKGK